MQLNQKNAPSILLLLLSIYDYPSNTQAYDCQTLLQDTDLTIIDWTSLEPCLAVANSEGISTKTSENVWRLIKIAFDGVENIPAEIYGKMRLVLTAITIDELHNISMSHVEIVEAFGGVHAMSSRNMSNGFSDEQMKVIARKVRNEWLGKEPVTYSEYDLISMGEIVCHLNESDITNIHADAFKAAAEFIGLIKSCPEAQLQSFAKLAMSEDAFGEVKDWSKIDVSAIGNIINGLSQSELAAIDERTLQLNNFYVQKQKENRKRINTQKNSTTANTTNNISMKKGSQQSTPNDDSYDNQINTQTKV